MIGSLFGRLFGGGTKAQTEQLFEQQTIFGEQQGFEQQLAKLIADPSSITSDPGYQFGLSQGLQGVQRQYGAMGLNKSGGAGSALMSFGENYAQNAWMQQIQMLGQLSGIMGGPPSSYGSAATSTGPLMQAFNSFLGAFGGGMGSAVGGKI